MRRRDRHYHNKWGYGLKEILNMPRDQFANMYGRRFLEMSDSKFKRVIVRETPYVECHVYGQLIKTIPDRMANCKEYIATQLSVWDDVNILI